MPHKIPWTTTVTDHPGSSKQEIDEEPEWKHGHQHRVGFTNNDHRVPGLTHGGEDVFEHQDEDDRADQDAIDEFKRLRKREQAGDLVNFRDIIEHQPVGAINMTLIAL